VAIKAHRFSVDEYHRLAEAAVLDEDDRVELIRGELIELTPIGSCHAESLRRLHRALASTVNDRAVVAVQDPLCLFDSEPQPDLMLLSPRPGGYWDAHPGAGDVLLVVEVVDTTARTDREVKLPLYAEAAVAEAWLVDLVAGCLEVRRDARPHGYRSITVARAGDTVSPAAFPEAKVEVAPLLR
jgi:Uma2 family endonuclease